MWQCDGVSDLQDDTLIYFQVVMLSCRRDEQVLQSLLTYPIDVLHPYVQLVYLLS
jgi:hypothetical protein